MSDEAALAAFREAVQRKYRLHVQAFEDCNPEPILTEFFWEDAVWECAGFPRRSGRAELTELFSEVVRTGHVAFHPISSHVEGNMGWDFVDYPVRPRDPAMSPFQFRCVFVWLNRGGNWKVHACVGFTVPYSHE